MKPKNLILFKAAQQSLLQKSNGRQLNIVELNSEQLNMEQAGERIVIRSDLWSPVKRVIKYGRRSYDKRKVIQMRKYDYNLLIKRRAGGIIINKKSYVVGA